MTKVLIDRAVVEQVLNDVCGAKLCEVNSMSSRVESRRLLDKATTALRTALAEQPAQTDWEAVAADQAMTIALLKAEQPAEQVPVGYMNAGHVHELQQKRIPYGYVYQNGGTGAEVAIYTAPQPANREPLTDEEIISVLGDPKYSTITAVRELIRRAAAPAWRAGVPLTDEELRDALRSCPHDTVESLRVRWLYAKDFARAIERAHGIAAYERKNGIGGQT